jgi:type II secretory pathway pseudopilin PulG
MRIRPPESQKRSQEEKTVFSTSPPLRLRVSKFSRRDRAPQTSIAAFTLLEIVVAIGLFTFIMVGVISCWECIIKGTEAARKATAEAQRARVSVKAIQDALTCTEINASPGAIQYYAFIADTSSKFSSLSLAARLPAAFPGSGLFGDNVMRRVTFDIEKGPDNENDLVMNQSPILMITSDQYPPYPITLARDVTAFNLEFWSPTENDWMTEFLATNQIPPMVRVSIGLGHSTTDPSVPNLLVTRVIAMPVQAHQ